MPTRLTPPLFITLSLALVLMVSGCQVHSDPFLSSIQVLPSAGQTLNHAGDTVQFQAIATFTKSNQTRIQSDVTSQVTWASTNTAVATVNSTGLATAVGSGTTSITATMGGSHVVQGAASLTVAGTNTTGGPRDLVSISIIPTAQTVSAIGQSAQFTAVGTFSSSPATQVLSATSSPAVSWSSSATQIATIDANGLATTTGPGTATLTARANPLAGGTVLATASITETATLPITRELLSISIIPTNQTFAAPGESSQFIAVGTFNTDPVTADMTNKATWASSDVQVARISTTGLAVGGNQGATAITASATDVASGAFIVSPPATLQSVQTAPNNLPALTVVELGSGFGTVISSPLPISCNNIPNAPSASLCSGSFTVGTAVTLTATAAAGSEFGGWSANCQPASVAPGTITATCTLTTNKNDVVGAIFNKK